MFPVTVFGIVVPALGVSSLLYYKAGSEVQFIPLSTTDPTYRDLLYNYFVNKVKGAVLSSSHVSFPMHDKAPVSSSWTGHWEFQETLKK